MATHTIKQGDLYPPIEATLSDANGAVDLTGASVRFIMLRRRGRVELVNADATIMDAATGSIRYQWVAGDTDEVGDHLAEFEVTFADTRVATWPNGGHLIVSVVRDLGNAP